MEPIFSPYSPVAAPLKVPELQEVQDEAPAARNTMDYSWVFNLIQAFALNQDAAFKI
jgi:hypothetical protein